MLIVFDKAQVVPGAGTCLRSLSVKNFQSKMESRDLRMLFLQI